MVNIVLFRVVWLDWFTGNSLQVSELVQGGPSSLVKSTHFILHPKVGGKVSLRQ